MKGLDRAKTAALSLTGVVVATAIGVAVTAAARSPEPVNAAGERTIALVSPRATSTPVDDSTPSPAASVAGEDRNPGPGGGSARGGGSSGPGGGSIGGSSGPGRARTAVAVSADTRGDGTPEDAPGSPPGDTRGDGTPEDGDNDNDNDSDDDDRSGHGGDDGAKDNSGPANYEDPGRSNSGGDDDD